MKIMHIVGNRPQFIKLAFLYKALKDRIGDGLILHTGQHFDWNMSQIFFEELQIPSPHYQLGVHGMDRNEMIGQMTAKAKPILRQERPDAAIVYGDTNSTWAGAEAAQGVGIPVIHIEAGVRTDDPGMPEEINRRLTDKIAYLNCCCTALGIENLAREGQVQTDRGPGTFLSGDLMLDAIRHFAKTAWHPKKHFNNIDLNKPFVFATIHRAENAGNKENLSNIVEALNRIHPQTPVLLPLHPKTRDAIDAMKLELKIETCEPLGYLDTISLLKRAQSVITDSGGLSREAFFLSKPTLVIMAHPFWPELFQYGNCLQSNADAGEMLQKHQSLSVSHKKFTVDVFGNGNAAGQIAERVAAAF